MRKKADLAFSVAVLAFVAWMLWQAHGWQVTASLFPFTIGLPALGLAALQCGFAVRGLVRPGVADAPMEEVGIEAGGFPHLASPIAMGEEQTGAVGEEHNSRRTLEMSVWIVVFAAGVVLLGFRVSAAVLPFLFMKIAARERWLTSALLGLGMYLVFFWIFVAGLHLVLPPGTIADALGVDSFDSYVVEPIGGFIGSLVAGR